MAKYQKIFRNFYFEFDLNFAMNHAWCSGSLDLCHCFNLKESAIAHSEDSVSHSLSFLTVGHKEDRLFLFVL